MSHNDSTRHGFDLGMRLWSLTYTPVHPSFQIDRLMIIMDSMENVTCGNPDVMLVLCPRLMDSYSPQAQGPLRWT